MQLAMSQLAGDLTPIYDQQRLVNDTTVTTPFSVFHTQDVNSVEIYGRHSKSVDSFASSSDWSEWPEQQSEWYTNTRNEVHGTTAVARARIPNISLILHGDSALLAAWLASDPVESRLDIAALPGQGSIVPPSMRIAGYAETITNKTWSASLNTVPLVPVAVTDSTLLAPLGHTLDASLTNVATTTTVDVPTSSPLWVTGVVDFYVDLGGEIVHVTNIAGAASPQTFTIVRGQYGTTQRAHISGTPVFIVNSADQQYVLALA
jgi:hypothetical protein